MAQLPRLTARRAGVLPSEDVGQEPTSTHTPCAGWMSINDYYEVTRVTPSGKTAYIRPLRKTYAGSPNDMSGCRAYPMVAGEGRFSGDEEAHRVHHFDDGRAYLRLSSFEFAFPMDMAEAVYGCHEDHND
ncbi:MAG: hypothetical protein Q3X74_04100 [Bifidobacterium sp.]|uniref:hypothetical protein n=1 Tax=Bifidobacterium sp. TaxID=41200 RepID=UPI0028411E32|nr:hypothetical protein [Bifidobacterium sp.]MDR3912334.1 hypothetical protein [Bifidobacterium sp.]